MHGWLFPSTSHFSFHHLRKEVMKRCKAFIYMPRECGQVLLYIKGPLKYGGGCRVCCSSYPCLPDFARDKILWTWVLLFAVLITLFMHTFAQCPRQQSWFMIIVCCLITTWLSCSILTLYCGSVITLDQEVKLIWVRMHGSDIALQVFIFVTLSLSLTSSHHTCRTRDGL